MENSQNDRGFYICNCGYFYSIKLSDEFLENYESKCRNCNSPIGYEERIAKNTTNIGSCYYL